MCSGIYLWHKIIYSYLCCSSEKMQIFVQRHFPLETHRADPRQFSDLPSVHAIKYEKNNILIFINVA